MKKTLHVISVIFTLMAVAFIPTNGQAESLNGTCADINLLATFDVPFGDFLQGGVEMVHGLAFDGQSLWAAHYYGGKIHKLGFNDLGELISVYEMDAPSLRPTGITFVGKNLFAGADDTLEISKIQTTGKKAGEIKSSFPAPGSDCTGLTYDGNYLWNADFNWGGDPEGLIHKIKLNGDPIGDPYESPDICPEGLAFANGFIWLAEWCENRIYKLNIANLTPECYFEGPGFHPIGLTFDGTYLWLSDQGTQEIYKIDIGE